MTTAPTIVNDWHSQLNPTEMAGVFVPRTLDELLAVLERSRRDGRPISLCGGRHAMGGQQFLSGGYLLDTSALTRVLTFDSERGLVEVEAGIQWPELIASLTQAQADAAKPWSIRQKQTGVDEVSLGGSLAANIHSRALTMPPFVADVESFTLIDAAGCLLRCSRDENTERFRLVCGGYGLFGLVYSITLRLARRQKLQRVVTLAKIEELIPLLEQRIEEGCLYGDFQYSCDAGSPSGYLRDGVCACYRPIADDTPVPEEQRVLTPERWRELIYLGHVDKARAFHEYAEHYLSTQGQIYPSDTHQLLPYDRGYHADIDQRMGTRAAATEMIAESFVPREALPVFMDAVRRDFLQHGTDVVYGTIRLIEPDRDTELAWATQPWVCVIFNLHVEHSPEGIERARAAFRRLIDRARELGGTYYPTYHRWATAEQIVACYPQLRAVLRRKRELDPEERFQSDWYRHHVRLLERAEPAR